MPNEEQDRYDLRLKVATHLLQGLLASEASGSGPLPSRAIHGSDADWKRACVREALQFADALIDEAGR